MEGSRRVKLSRENDWLSRIASPLTAEIAAGVSFIVVSRLVAVTTISSTTDSCALTTVAAPVATRATAWATTCAVWVLLNLMQAPQWLSTPDARSEHRPIPATEATAPTMQLAYHHMNR